MKTQKNVWTWNMNAESVYMSLINVEREKANKNVEMLILFQLAQTNTNWRPTLNSNLYSPTIPNKRVKM